MNRVTVRRLLYIQCEQKRSHDIDIEGHIGVCEKKRKQNAVILVVFLLFFILVIPARFLVRGKKKPEKILFFHLELLQTTIFYFLSSQKETCLIYKFKKNVCALDR